ncbi:MAG: glycosyltransferase [Acidobacteria bacterium]|nr:glycosyltransferase [Acidobacteriota bacterium]
MPAPVVIPSTLQPHRASRIVVVLPAYNEEANIGSLLRRIFESLSDEHLGFSIIVVDDGSNDRTRQILEEYGAGFPLIVHRHDNNQGLGATLRDGLREAAAVAGERDIVITMDADESHTPGLMIRMIRMIREGYDVVIASRYQPGSRIYGLGLGRRLISRAASLLMRLVFPTPGVSDFTCGYRAYRAEALQQAYARYGDSLVDQDGFQCMVDILLKLRRLPLIFGEVPLILRYDLKRGKSKMHLARTTVKTLRLLCRRRFGGRP